MPPRLIDLSVPLTHQATSEPFPASIRYVDHAEGAAQMQQLFGVDPEQPWVSYREIERDLSL